MTERQHLAGNRRDSVGPKFINFNFKLNLRVCHLYFRALALIASKMLAFRLKNKISIHFGKLPLAKLSHWGQTRM
jgi:hypothetical protein